VTGVQTCALPILHRDIRDAPTDFGGHVHAFAFEESSPNFVAAVAAGRLAGGGGCKEDNSNCHPEHIRYAQCKLCEGSHLSQSRDSSSQRTLLRMTTPECHCEHVRYAQCKLREATLAPHSHSATLRGLACVWCSAGVPKLLGDCLLRLPLRLRSGHGSAPHPSARFARSGSLLLRNLDSTPSTSSGC